MMVYIKVLMEERTGPELVNGIAEPVVHSVFKLCWFTRLIQILPSCTIFNAAANATNGIYKTTDGGANWFPIINGIGAIKNFLSLAMSPADPNTIYAGSFISILQHQLVHLQFIKVQMAVLTGFYRALVFPRLQLI